MKNPNVKFRRILLPLIISGLLLTTVLWWTDTKSVFAELADTSLWTILVIVLLFGINLFVVTFRLGRVLTHFGYKIPFAVVAKANISGHVAGFFFISLFAQVAGRHLMLRKTGIPSVVIASITAYERFIALLISGGMFLLGATILLDDVSVHKILYGIPIYELIVAIAGGLFVSLWFWRSKFESEIIARIFSWSKSRWLFEISFITLIGRLFVLTAFIYGAAMLKPDADLWLLFAAAGITSFAANLPLSIHGWGVREITAVYTLGLLGISSAEALALSILIGLCASFVIIAAVPFATKKQKISDDPDYMNVKSTALAGLQIDKVAAWIMSTATVVLVFFQIHVEIYGGLLSLNLADPFAILSLAAIAMHIASSRQLPSWRISHFNLILLTTSLLLVFGFVVGLSEIGLTQWALANRLTGWLVLLGYLSVGYLAVSYMGRHGLRRIIETMAATAVVVVILQLVLRSLLDAGLIDMSSLTSRFQGYAANRNAFAFQMLTCSVLLLGYSSLYARSDKFGKFVSLSKEGMANRLLVLTKAINNRHLLLVAVFHGVILAGLVFSGSRAGIITGIALLILATLMKLADRRMVILSIIFGAIVWTLPMLDINFSKILGGSSGVGISEKSKITYEITVIRDTSDNERLETFTRGLQMWSDSPFFGAGLGVFIEKSTDWSKKPINIHNTPIWILAEFGLLGVALFIWILFVILRFVFKVGFASPANRIIVMLLFSFLLFSLTHEIFYQRIFWIVLGATIASAGIMNRRSTE